MPAYPHFNREQSLIQSQPSNDKLLGPLVTQIAIPHLLLLVIPMHICLDLVIDSDSPIDSVRLGLADNRMPDCISCHHPVTRA